MISTAYIYIYKGYGQRRQLVTIFPNVRKKNCKFYASVFETPCILFEFDSQSQRPTDGYTFTCMCSDRDRDVFVIIKQRVCRRGEGKQRDRFASCLQQVSGAELISFIFQHDIKMFV